MPRYLTQPAPRLTLRYILTMSGLGLLAGFAVVIPLVAAVWR